MSKELSPLEALEIIKHAPTIYVGCVSDIYTSCPYEYKIIETALVRLEKLEKASIQLSKDSLELIKECRKQDKVLQIIKECFVFNGFDELIPNSKWFDDEEKQNLLKEVLK